jgi:hypothetical protein
MRRRLWLIALTVPLMAAVPRLSPSPPGTILHQVSAPLAGGGGYTVVASRSPRGTAGLFQYYLSIYAGWPGVAWHRVYTSQDNADHLIPQVAQGHGTTRYFPTQSLKLLGMIDFGAGTPLAVAEMHNAAADCGDATVMLLGPRQRHQFGPVAVIGNPCALTAKIAGHYIVLNGPYYAKGAPLYKPTINKAQAILRFERGGFTETPDYFKVKLGFWRQPAQP